MREALRLTTCLVIALFAGLGGGMTFTSVWMSRVTGHGVSYPPQYFAYLLPGSIFVGIVAAFLITNGWIFPRKKE